MITKLGSSCANPDNISHMAAPVNTIKTVIFGCSWNEKSFFSLHRQTNLEAKLIFGTKSNLMFLPLNFLVNFPTSTSIFLVPTQPWWGRRRPRWRRTRWPWPTPCRTARTGGQSQTDWRASARRSCYFLTRPSSTCTLQWWTKCEMTDKQTDQLTGVRNQLTA